MRYQRLVACLTSASLMAAAGCASHPDKIDAKYVSPVSYQSWSCENLLEERTRLSREVTRVAGLQRENANADAAMMTVGLIILWPALLGMAATKDRKDELARLKGEYEAVEEQGRIKQCQFPPPPPAQVEPVAAPDPTPAHP